MEPAPEAPPSAPAAVSPKPVQPPPPAWSWTSRPGAVDDQGVDGEERHPPRVPWKGTSLISSHAVTTSAVGIGGEYQSRAYQVYSQGYALLLNYYLYDHEGTTLRVAVTPGVDVEVTDSNETDEKNELVFADLPIAVVGGIPLYAPKDSLVRTSVGANFTTILATSKYTRGAGDIATLSPRLTFTQALPLFGKGAPILESFQFGGVLRYDHLISDAEVQVAEGLGNSGTGERPTVANTDQASVSAVHTPRTLQDGSGNTAYSDVLSGQRLAPNTFRVGGFVAFSEELGIPFELALGVAYTEAYLYDAAATEVETLTGAVEVPADQGRSKRRLAGVSAGPTLFPLTELGIALSYENAADLDGPSPDMFYAPRAQFTGALIVSLDAIYERATGPARTEPFVLY